MAVAFTTLTSGGDTSNVSSYSTASITPTAGSLLLVWVVVTDADDPGTINISTGLTGVTWVEQFNLAHFTIAVPLRRLKLWTGTGHSGSGTITFDGMPDVCTGAAHLVMEATGYDTGTPIVQAVTHVDDVDALTETTTFAAYGSTDNAVISAFTKGIGTTGFTEEAGWTKVLGTDANYTTPNCRLNAQYQLSATDTTSEMTWLTTNSSSCSGGVEIKAAIAAGGGVWFVP